MNCLIQRIQPDNHLLQFTERGLALVIFVVVVSQLRLVSREDFQKIATRFGNNKLVRRFFAERSINRRQSFCKAARAGLSRPPS